MRIVNAYPMPGGRARMMIYANAGNDIDKSLWDEIRAFAMQRVTLIKGSPPYKDVGCFLNPSDFSFPSKPGERPFIVEFVNQHADIDINEMNGEKRYIVYVNLGDGSPERNAFFFNASAAYVYYNDACMSIVSGYSLILGYYEVSISYGREGEGQTLTHVQRFQLRIT